jgi:transcriptional regulatory protein RtcR
MRSTVLIGLLGSRKDAGEGPERWARWRPTVGLCRQGDLLVGRVELLHQGRFAGLARQVADDIHVVSPQTDVRLRPMEFGDPWNFETVYAALHDFTRNYRFDVDREEYFVHVNVGTHVARISLFLLTESRHFPAKLIQSVPPERSEDDVAGSYRVIDLDLSQYDLIASRFRREQHEARSILKSGIGTCNPAFNALVERIEQVALAAPVPLLLVGPTGAGKSRLARQIYELRKARGLVTGRFVEVNCGTIRGDAAMSALFGHVKGAFTGAVQSRAGLLRAADRGILLLDEIGELGLDEQTMLLRALEERTFLPVGADREETSDFQLVAGTNRDLSAAVRSGRFRDDLLARIDLWTFRLPGLRERPEDIEPNIEHELERVSGQVGTCVRLNREARDLFLRFAVSPAAKWTRNFRDLNSAILRMSTVAKGGRISTDIVREEIQRLTAAWRALETAPEGDLVGEVLGGDRAAELDRFDRVQLEDVLRVCRDSRTLADAGRKLYAVSRTRKSSTNDAHRIRTYLARFGLRSRDVLGLEQ